MATLLEMAGAGPQKQPKYAPIFMDRAFTGIFTQRSVLHDPSDIYTSKYYGGRPDALWAGKNIELTNRLTLQRRPGLVAFSVSPFDYPTQPLRAYSFQLTDGTIRVMVDTQPTPSLVLTGAIPATSFVLSQVTVTGGTTVYTGTFTGVGTNNFAGVTFVITGFGTDGNNTSFTVVSNTTTTITGVTSTQANETNAGVATSGSTVYAGTITGGASNAYVGLKFTVAGFTNTANDGLFICTASTSTTLTLTNSKGVTATEAATGVSSGAVYWDKLDGTTTMIYAKTTSAGQSYFLGSGGILYVGDGVDTWKWTPKNTNTNSQSSTGQSVWNWGIVAPLIAPSYTIEASGAAAAAWQPSTVFSTMGLTKDAFGQAWQLVSVNADGTQANTTQFGTTGQGNPPFNPALGSITTETSGTGITWQNMGALTVFSKGLYYGNYGWVATPPDNCCIWDAASGSVYGQWNGSGSAEHATYNPSFNASQGNFAGGFNGGAHWICIGNYKAGQLFPWKPSTAYVHPGAGWTGSPGAPAANTVFFPFIFPPPDLSPSPSAKTFSPVYVYQPTISGTSGASYAPFVDYTGTPTGTNKDAGVGNQIPDTKADGTFNLSWLCLGWASWQSSHSYVPFTVFGTDFGAIYDGTNWQICVTPAGVKKSGATAPGVGGNPAWATTYGGTTQDGDVLWQCMGPNVSWAATQIWHLPLNGFQPQNAAEKYGGSTIEASGTVFTTTASGTSGAAPPTWPAVGSSVTEAGSNLTWYGENLAFSNSLKYSKGYSYGYSYKARAYDDYYSALPLGGGNFPPPNNETPIGLGLGLPTGSATEAVSSSSPAITFPIGTSAGSVITVTGPVSLDPQVDTIIIWRSADGGGPDQMFELTEVPNAANTVINGIGYWSFQDWLPDTADGVYPGLNYQIPASINNVNDPPFSTFLPQVYNFQRIWGADGEFVDFSGGPDTLVGNPDEAFSPSDGLPFLAPVVRVVKSAQGLITYLTDSIQVIAGGPATATFFSVEWAAGIGLLSYNALDVFAGEQYFFSSDNQFRVMTPSLNITNAGFALGDQFANQPNGTADTTWDPAQVYVASHQSGTDNAIFVADGNTGWYRLNPRQAGAMPNTEPVWSPFAAITNGCQMVQSVEVSPGIKKLLVGSQTQNEPLFERSQAIYTDNGTSYDAYFEMGNIALCHPGQLALLKFVEFDFNGVKFQPTISYLLNEISGTFVPFTAAPVFDPPSLYGDTIAPTSYSPCRYYFASNASLARCRHLRLKVDFGTTSNGDELLSATIFGRLMVEV